MLLDEAKKAEQKRRKGFARRFIFAVIWLLLTIIIANYVIDWLIESGRLTYNQVIVNLNLPASITQNMIRAGLIGVVVIVMQFITMLILAIFLPAGRERTGRPTAESRETTQDDYKYYRR